MKKRTTIIIFLMFLLLFQFFNIEEVAAKDTLEEQYIHVFINEDGSARITEKRVAYLTEGTENYIVIGNLGNSTILDFVVNENGKTYQYTHNWDINASQDEKAFKNGLIKTEDGYELSWGIGEYGWHEYTIEYTITNFIKQLEDSQILFWRFVNDQTNIPPEEVTVVIETDKRLSDSTEKIWAFGFDGEIQFEDGKVVAISEQPLNQDDYVTVLIKFSDGMFGSTDYIDQPFEDIKEEAFEGSDYGKEKTDSNSSGLVFIIPAVLFILLIRFTTKQSSVYKLTKKKPKKFKPMFKGEYTRSLSYEGDIFDIYYLLYIMGASNFEKLLTSYILKWVKEERITVETERVGIIHKRDEAALYFFNKDMDKENPEGELFHMMLDATGSNDILESNEFSVWARKNHKKLIAWEKKIIKNSTKKLEQLGYIQLEKKKKFIFKTEDYELTSKGLELEDNIHKFANFLRNYSLLNEHEAVNVKIWDEIMILAAMIGLTKVVQKQFKKLYPNYVNETVYSGSSIYYASAFSTSTSNARTSGSVGDSGRSSGGGGSVSSGGGGGSFGGGSGGGTR
ncbi:MAG TPA: DUF2207 domain-containing protein [Candidatus Dormibacteraeota bacterium]|nr:DUF2207 domain-containing protein [Candidatus Dormibacteraeota bacterium]